MKFVFSLREKTLLLDKLLSCFFCLIALYCTQLTRTSPYNFISYFVLAYSKDLKDLIIEMSEASAKLGTKLDSYREQLIAEEALSQMMKPSQKYH